MADFLTKIQLPQYVESFRTSEISGELLLEADPEILEELGVTSPLHQMKIMQLFRRELEGSVVKYNQDHVTCFLQQLKLEKYVSALREHGIDGDMVLQVDEALMKSVLREVGVVSRVDSLKIRSKYKKFVADTGRSALDLAMGNVAFYHIAPGYQFHLPSGHVHRHNAQIKG